MHVHFHIETPAAVYTDEDGVECRSLLHARELARDAVRGIYLANEAASISELNACAVLITPPSGRIERVPFMDALCGSNACFISEQAGHA